MSDLFAADGPREIIPDVFLLPAFAQDTQLLQDLKKVLSEVPFQHMQTPGGRTIQAAMSACGDVGWVSDRTGYRYSRINPRNQLAWPAIPASFLSLARAAAAACRFNNFEPDSCLINRYQPGSGMGRHCDDQEPDITQPVVSVSLGMSATFQVFPPQQNARPVPIDLHHGDVMVWGRTARHMQHALKPIRSNPHAVIGRCRLNLTLRKAL